MKANFSANLQRSIIIYCVIGILVIGVVSAAAGILPLYDRLKIEQERNLSFAVHTRSMAIEQYLTRSEDVALQVTSRTKIRLKLEAYNRGEIPLTEVVSFSKKLLEDAMNKSEELVGITRLDAKNRFALQIGKQIPKEIWPVPSSNSKKALVEGPIKLGGEEYLIVGAPILSRSGERSGTDIVLFTLASLKQIIADYKGLGDTGESMLGISTTDGLRTLFALRNSQSQTPSTIETNSSIGTAMQHAFTKKNGIIANATENKTPVVIAYGPIKNGDWALAVKMNKDELYGSINKQITTVSIIIIALIFLGTIGMIFLLRPLTGKIVLQADELQKEIDEKTADLVHNQKRLEIVNKELDQFAYITSHDLKAPLRAIANLSEWIEEDIGDTIQGETKRQMGLLRTRVHRLEGLIEGILQYSRVGRDKVSIEDIDTGELVGEVIDNLSPPAEFTIHVGGNMPALHTSKVRFSQVMSNLVGNAIKYHDRSDGTINISVRNTDDDFYEFSIKDDGPGIASEYHDKIFVIFQTLQSRDDIESTGIGLTVVKKIIDEEGGIITVESLPGKGTTFRFTWPKTSVKQVNTNTMEAA